VFDDEIAGHAIAFAFTKENTMRKQIITAAFAATSLVLVALAGCRNQPAETATETKAAPAAQSTMPPAVAAASTPYDLQFIDTMSRHHQGAVQMATMAHAKIRLSQLKELTRRIPVDQQKEIDQMKSWRDQWYPGAPSAEDMQMPGMSGSMKMDMSHMESRKPGREYDAMFIDMMTSHHQGALQMAQEALGKAEHPEIKTLAQQIIGEQTKEIEQMKQWKAKLGK